MFCSDCGAQATGKYCSQCGHPLQPGSDIVTAELDWQHSIDYATVSREPSVVAELQQAESRSKKRLQGESLLELVDTLASPLTYGLTTRTAAKVLTPITSALGFRVQRTREEQFNVPVGRVLARVLIALAERGQKINHVHQQPEACELTAEMPPDLCSYDGTLQIVITATAHGANVRMAAVVEGQWYDWGKCDRRISDVLQAIRAA